MSSFLIDLLCKIGRIHSATHEYRYIAINGQPCIGLLDNQAYENVMSLDFARSHGVRIVPARVPFLLATNVVHHSLGYAIVTCATSREDQFAQHAFYVFAHALHPLILGRDLARQYYGLQGHSQAHNCLAISQENSIIHGDNKLVWSDRLVTKEKILKLRINNTLDIMVTLDCGSDFDAISLALARRLGFEPGHDPILKQFRIADGRMMESKGIFDVVLQSVWEGDRQISIKRTFTVVENLVFDLILGNQFIQNQMGAQDFALLLWSGSADTPPRLVAAIQSKKKLNASSFRPLGWIKEKCGKMAHKKDREGNTLCCLKV